MACCNAPAANVANTSQRRRICSSNTPGPANEYKFIAATVEPSSETPAGVEAGTPYAPAVIHWLSEGGGSARAVCLSGGRVCECCRRRTGVWMRQERG